MAKKRMLAFSPERSLYLEGVVKELGYPAEKKKMFGHEVLFLNGYMFTGANVDGVFVHVGQKERDRALEEERATSVFSPMEGMVMREYLLLREPLCSDENELRVWLHRAKAYLMSLPPKAKR